MKDQRVYNEYGRNLYCLIPGCCILAQDMYDDDGICKMGPTASTWRVLWSNAEPQQWPHSHFVSNGRPHRSLMDHQG